MYTFMTLRAQNDTKKRWRKKIFFFVFVCVENVATKITVTSKFPYESFKKKNPKRMSGRDYTLFIELIVFSKFSCFSLDVCSAETSSFLSQVHDTKNDFWCLVSSLQYESLLKSYLICFYLGRNYFLAIKILYTSTNNAESEFGRSGF